MFYENCSYWTNLNKCSWKSSNIDISEIRVLVSLELKLLSPEMKDLILLLGESMQPFEDLLFCNHTMNRIRICLRSALHNWIHHICYLNGQKQLLGHPEIYVVALSNLLNINYHLLSKLIFYAQVKFLNIFSLIGQINENMKHVCILKYIISAKTVVKIGKGHIFPIWQEKWLKFKNISQK